MSRRIYRRSIWSRSTRRLDEIKDDYFDGMILTGAPVEQMPFEQVDYWQELCEIFEFAKTARLQQHVHLLGGSGEHCTTTTE